MYGIQVIIQDKTKPESAKNIEKFSPLLKTVLGYTDKEIDRMIEKEFSVYAIAGNLTKDQVKLAFQPFYDIDAPLYIEEYDDNTGELIEVGVDEQSLGMIKQEPKEHYYDTPVVSREHLFDPDYIPTPKYIVSNTQPVKPTITCPYCQSTDTKKITNTSKAVHTALFGIFAMGRNAKEWHCNNCNSDF